VRLPRWLVVSLLSASVLAMLGAGVWWWVTWPERTAAAVPNLVSENRWDELRSIANLNSALAWRTLDNPNPVQFSKLPRSLLDVISGRQRFLIQQRMSVRDIDLEVKLTFTAQNGSLMDFERSSDGHRRMNSSF
jgi:hypothetical protein